MMIRMMTKWRKIKHKQRRQPIDILSMMGFKAADVENSFDYVYSISWTTTAQYLSVISKSWYRLNHEILNWAFTIWKIAYMRVFIHVDKELEISSREQKTSFWTRKIFWMLERRWTALISFANRICEFHLFSAWHLLVLLELMHTKSQTYKQHFLATVYMLIVIVKYNKTKHTYTRTNIRFFSKFTEK